MEKTNSGFDWSLAYFLILLTQILLMFIGLFVKTITFGCGLGDIIWWFFWFFEIICSIILIFIKPYSQNKYKIGSLLCVLFIFFIFYKATLGRDIEYPWNGNIFYTHKK